jgi:outer membrane protein
MQLNRTTGMLHALLLLILLASSAALAQEASKVGVIDFQAALLGTAEMQAKSKELNEKFQPREEELAQLSKDLQDLQQKLQSAGGNEAMNLQNQAQRKQREAQRKQEDLQSDFDYDRNEILQSGARAMRDVISKLAEEKGLDIVVDVTNTFFFRPALNLTAAATEAYNQQKQAP